MVNNLDLILGVLVNVPLAPLDVSVMISQLSIVTVKLLLDDGVPLSGPLFPNTPSELNPLQRIPSPLYCTTCAEGRGLTIVLTFYSGRLFDVHVRQFDTYNSERFVNQSTQSQSWRESCNPMFNQDICEV